MVRNLPNLHIDHAAAQYGENPLKSLWISANAGSGKTTELTARVIKLLLLGVTPERICAITYTKAAAGEMRSRILKRLQELLLVDDTTCKALAEKFLERTATEDELKRARALFGQVLESPHGGIRLTTIHGFCQQLLRSFPLEANIAPHFSVIDDTEASLIAARVKHRLLDRMQIRDQALEAAISLVAERCTETRFNTLASSILQQRETWERIWHLQTPQTLHARLFALFDIESNLSEDMLTDLYCEHVSEEDATIIRTQLPALMKHKNKREQNLSNVLARWLEATDRRSLIDEMMSLWLTEKGELRKTAYSDKDFPALVDVFERLKETACRYVERCAALACAQESYAMTVLARVLLDLYTRTKDERGILDFADLIEKTEKLIAGDMAAWVMMKLDHRIDHLLIDEAQDTSAGQWAIAESLVRELISDPSAFRSVLVVGDEKQSIYSFQGAAPELYATKEPEFAELLSHSTAPLVGKKLSTSYRSAPAILKFIDAVTAHPLVNPALSARGEPLPHQLARKQDLGRVVLHASVVPEEKPSLSPLTIPTEYQLLRNGPQLLAVRVAEEVAKQVKAGHWLPGDVLILVRKRAPIVQPLLRALQRQGLPVAGLDRLVLAEHLAVKDLLALMQFCGSDRDDLALAQVLRSPLVGLGDEELRELAFGRSGTLWEQVEERHASARLIGRWREIHAATPYDFLTRVLEEDDTRSNFVRRFGEEVHEILDELKAQAADMPTQLAPTLTNFCQMIETSDQQIKRELEHGSGEQIRVMTAYGAKGLEAKVVLVVDTTSVPTLNQEILFTTCDAHGQLLPVASLSSRAKDASLLRQAKQMRQQAVTAEYYRLLYVAITRAKDELHIFGDEPSRGEIKPESWYAILSDCLRQIGEEVGSNIVLEDASILPKPEKRSKKSTTLPGWAKQPVETPKRAVRLKPSGLAPEPVLPFARRKEQGAKERGVRIHRILQFMDHSVSDAQLVALVKHIAPDWDAKEQQQVCDDIRTLLKQEPWLFEQSDAEPSIAGTLNIEGQPYVFSGQIDRLVRTRDGLVVVDYKTTREVPAAAKEVSLSYLYQLKTYAELLKLLYPGQKIRCAIVWTAGPSVMDLTEQVEELGWQRVLTGAA